MTSFTTTNPSDGSLIAQFEMLSRDELLDTLTTVSGAFAAWSTAELAERARVLGAIAQGHLDRREELAALMAAEMGKPIVQARGEVDLAASIYTYYSQKAQELLRDEELEVAGGGRAIVRTAPIGTVLGIMPWNFPLYQVARFVAPNLILGNTVLLKHARSCAGTSVAIEEIVLAVAGEHADIYRNLLIAGEDVEPLIADPRVHGVSLTGSEEAGRRVGALAGQHLKKCVLELGGSDPLIVLDDADLGSALDFAENGRFGNAGQSCTSPKRIIVSAKLWDPFVRALAERAATWVGGDPQLETTKLGPMASTSARTALAEQVDDAVGKGAILHVGGAVPDGAGAYYPATVLSGVTPAMRAYEEELFGPVAVLYRVDSTEEAVRLANDTPFGLAASVFSNDSESARAVAERLEAGMVGVNTTIRSQPNLPFGGVKSSGIGRELGRFGIDEFANKKLLRIADPA